MILPHSFTASILLLIASFVCLGSWAALFKRTGKAWRFELFYYDFGVGAILLAVVAAYTLGTLGADLSFSDRMMVAGRTAQAMLVAAGFLFNLGNMLLLASVSLTGMAVAFPLSIGVALLVSSFWNFHAGNFFLLVAAIIVLLACAIVSSAAARLRAVARLRARLAAKPGPKPDSKRKPQPLKTRRTSKGILTGVLGGILMGLVPPLAQRGMGGEFGLGGYAAILMFAIGIIVSTIFFNFYFVNISIEGGPIGFKAYFRGTAGQHFLGFASGALLVLGLLCALLARSAPRSAGADPALLTAIPVASVFLAVLWGLTAWREFAKPSSGARPALAIAILLFACGLALFSISV
ncbi:MAG: hypothetical protein ACRD34_00780 [Bryobacteraceae bacterium]